MSGLVEPAENPNRRDDAALVARIRDGEDDAVKTILEMYGGAVKSIALRVLRNETLAEDTTQDVFVALWQAPEKYDSGRGSLRTFLVTLAHRRAVDAVRSEQSRFRREEKVPQDVAGSIDDEVWSRSVSESVRRAVEELNEGERDAIKLAYFGALTYVEVAKQLGVPEGTVKSRIRSGMRKLSLALASVEA